jgi:multidrug resistance efflux pump
MRQKFYALLVLVLVLCLGAAGCGVTKTKRTLTLTGKLENPVTAITAPRDGKVLGLILEKGDRIRKDEPLICHYQKRGGRRRGKSHGGTGPCPGRAENCQRAAPALPRSGRPPGPWPARKLPWPRPSRFYDKMAKLYSIGGVAKKKLDQSQANLSAAQENYAATQAHLRQLQTRATPEAVTDLEEKSKKFKSGLRGRSEKPDG